AARRACDGRGVGRATVGTGVVTGGVTAVVGAGVAAISAFTGGYDTGCAGAAAERGLRVRVAAGGMAGGGERTEVPAAVATLAAVVVLGVATVTGLGTAARVGLGAGGVVATVSGRRVAAAAVRVAGRLVAA